MPRIPDDDEPMAVVIEEPPPASGEQTLFEVFLSSLDEETRELVGEAALQAIFEAQQIKARDAKREKLKRAATEKATQAANVSAGLLPAEATAHAEWRKRMDRKVIFTPYLPELGDIGLRVDGIVYLHGMPATVTMAQYLSYRYMEWASKQAGNSSFEGRSRSHSLRQSAIGKLDMRLNWMSDEEGKFAGMRGVAVPGMPDHLHQAPIAPDGKTIAWKMVVDDQTMHEEDLCRADGDRMEGHAAPLRAGGPPIVRASLLQMREAAPCHRTEGTRDGSMPRSRRRASGFGPAHSSK